jgi:hypothetical protein
MTEGQEKNAAAARPPTDQEWAALAASLASE